MEPSRAEYMLSVQEKLNLWSSQIDTLVAQTKATSGPSRNSLLAKIAELQMLQVVGRQHLASVQTAAKASRDASSLMWRGTGRRYL